MITKPVTPHALRHTYAVNCVKRGVSPASLKKILDHDRLETTEIYLNISPEDARREFFQKVDEERRLLSKAAEAMIHPVLDLQCCKVAGSSIPLPFEWDSVPTAGGLPDIAPWSSPSAPSLGSPTLERRLQSFAT